MSAITNRPSGNLPTFPPAVQSPSTVDAKSHPRHHLISTAGKSSIICIWSGLKIPPSAGAGLCIYCPANTYGLASSIRFKSCMVCLASHKAVPSSLIAGKQICSQCSPLPPFNSQPDKSSSCNLCIIRITGVSGLFLRLSRVF